MALPLNALFNGADLTGLLHRTVTDDDVVAAEKVVWGRVRGLLGLDTRPDSLSDTLAGAVLELGAIAYTNPEALARYVLEGEMSFYDDARWNEILDSVATGGTVAPGASPAPRGSFPQPTCYPDPSYPFGRFRTGLR